MICLGAGGARPCVSPPFGRVTTHEPPAASAEFIRLARTAGAYIAGRSSWDKSERKLPDQADTTAALLSPVCHSCGMIKMLLNRA